EGNSSGKEGPAKWSAQRGGAAQERDQLVALGSRDVGDEAVSQPVLRPGGDPVPAQGEIAPWLVAGSRRDEEVQHVLPPAIHERRRRVTGEHVEAASGEHETPIGEVASRYREIDAALEPRLDGVL